MPRERSKLFDNSDLCLSFCQTSGVGHARQLLPLANRLVRCSGTSDWSGSGFHLP